MSKKRIFVSAELLSGHGSVFYVSLSIIHSLLPEHFIFFCDKMYLHSDVYYADIFLTNAKMVH